MRRRGIHTCKCKHAHFGRGHKLCVSELTLVRMAPGLLDAASTTEAQRLHCPALHTIRMHGVDLSGPATQLLLSRLLAADQLLLLELSHCPWVTDSMVLEVLSRVHAARGGMPLLAAAAEQASRVLLR